MSAEQDLIVGPEWDDENVGWFYDIPASKADGKDSWTLVAMEAPGGSSKYILSLWVGGREGPVGDDIEALSDPLNITDSKDLEKFEKIAIDHFEDKRDMGWLDLVLEYVRRNHERAKTKRRKQEVRERTKAADRHIPGTTGISYYVEAEGGLAVVERDEYKSLANFSARITEVVEVDTGSGDPPQRVFTIQARHAGNDYTFQVPATEFDSVRWVRQHLDSRAIYNPSVGKVKEHIKTAILSDSAEQVRSKAYRHLGWRMIDGRWVYIHSGGGITTFAAKPPEVRVLLEDKKLLRRVLPQPVRGESLKKAVRETFKLWDLTDGRITIPLDLSAKRAVIGTPDYFVHLFGPSGTGKTEYGRMLLSYFGADAGGVYPTADGHTGEMSFDSTAYALEEHGYLAKDQLILYDDYRPNTEPSHVAVLGRVGRAAGNRGGRSRMSSSGASQGDRPPRGLILATGEDKPRGERSLVGRTLLVPVDAEHRIIPGPDSPNLSPKEMEAQLDKVQECQQAAREGIYAEAMAGFVAWLADRYEEVRDSLAGEHTRLRKEIFTLTHHTRTPGIYADLTIAVNLWLDYCRSIKAISPKEYEAYKERAHAAILEAVEEHGRHLPPVPEMEITPVVRYRTLLQGALDRNGDGTLRHEAVADGPVGWVRDDGIYLVPKRAHDLVKSVAIENGGSPFTTSLQTTNRYLKEEGMLLSTALDKRRASIAVRKKLGDGGKMIDVLHLRKDFLEG